MTDALKSHMIQDFLPHAERILTNLLGAGTEIPAAEASGDPAHWLHAVVPINLYSSDLEANAVHLLGAAEQLAAQMYQLVEFGEYMWATQRVYASPIMNGVGQLMAMVAPADVAVVP